MSMAVTQHGVASAGVQRTPNASLRIFKIVVVGLLLITLVLLGSHAIDMNLASKTIYPILHVNIEGQFRNIKTKHLEVLVTPYLQHGFFNIDMEAIHSTLLTEPWVHSVNIRRLWPAGLRIIVKEKQAIAIWSKEALLSYEGELFRPSLETFHEGLINLAGPVGTEKLVLSQLHAVQPYLESTGLKITKLTLTDRRSWLVDVDSGMKLILGQAVDLNPLERFVKAYSKLTAEYKHNIAQADLRYTNGFSVRWLTGIDKSNNRGMDAKEAR